MTPDDIKRKAEELYKTGTWKPDTEYGDTMKNFEAFGLSCYHAGLREAYEDAAEWFKKAVLDVFTHTTPKWVDVVVHELRQKAQSVGKKEGEE